MCSSYIEFFSLLGCYAACIDSQSPMFRDILLAPSSRVKQDNGGKNSMLPRVPNDRRSHFIVNNSFPVKPFLFLVENQHCSK